jgi:hypothetical protein
MVVAGDLDRSIKIHPSYHLEGILYQHQTEAIERTNRRVRNTLYFVGLQGPRALAELLAFLLPEFIESTNTEAATIAASPFSVNISSDPQLPQPPQPPQQPQQSPATNPLTMTGTAMEASLPSDSEAQHDTTQHQPSEDENEEDSVTQSLAEEAPNYRFTMRRREPILGRDDVMLPTSISGRGDASSNSSSSSALSISSRKHLPPSELDVHSYQDLQDEVLGLRETVRACYQALLSVKQNADLKIQNLELQVLYLERKLADEQALTSKLSVSNQSLRRELQACFKETREAGDKRKYKKMIHLHQREVTTEKNLNTLLAARNLAVHQNTMLKKMLLQTCENCRARLPLKRVRTTGPAVPGGSPVTPTTPPRERPLMPVTDTPSSIGSVYVTGDSPRGEPIPEPPFPGSSGASPTPGIKPAPARQSSVGQLASAQRQPPAPTLASRRPSGQAPIKKKGLSGERGTTPSRRKSLSKAATTSTAGPELARADSASKISPSKLPTSARNPTPPRASAGRRLTPPPGRPSLSSTRDSASSRSDYAPRIDPGGGGGQEARRGNIAGSSEPSSALPGDSTGDDRSSSKPRWRRMLGGSK